MAAAARGIMYAPTTNPRVIGGSCGHGCLSMGASIRLRREDSRAGIPNRGPERLGNTAGETP
jgi:hypothetical protein